MEHGVKVISKSEIIYQMYLDGASVKEIAETMKISKNAVYRHIESMKNKKNGIQTGRIRYDAEKLRREIESGYTIKQLAAAYGVERDTLRRWCTKSGIDWKSSELKEKEMSAREKEVAARCKKCHYRMEDVNLKNAGAHCDYITVVGHSRGCPASECDKFEPAKNTSRRRKMKI